MDKKDKIVVAVDEDLVDLVPIYLGNRKKDLARARAALEDGDFETIRVIGHQMKGSGGGYGMERLSALGAELEEGSDAMDASEVSRVLGEVSEYIGRVEAVPEE